MITLPQVQRHQASYLLGKKQIRALEHIGFRLYDQKDKLILFLPCSTPVDLVEVKKVFVYIKPNAENGAKLPRETLP